MPSPKDNLLYVDMSNVLQGFEDFHQDFADKLDNAAQLLAAQADAHIKEQAAERLHTRKDEYVEALDLQPVGKGVYAVTLKAEARWIEDGMEPHNMLEDLLASDKAKTAKDGSKYLVVPFKHSKGPAQQTGVERRILSAIKKELRRNRIPYKRIEKNPDGSPKLGLVHSLNLAPPHSTPLKPGYEGPKDKVFKGKTDSPYIGGTPYTFGTRIYQHPMKNEKGDVLMGKDGHPKVERSIFTFRVASSKQAGTGMWDHPGVSPMHFFEEAHQWIQQEWDNKIAPDIIRSLGFA
jgi:hypothetical protein